MTQQTIDCWSTYNNLSYHLYRVEPYYKKVVQDFEDIINKDLKKIYNTTDLEMCKKCNGSCCSGCARSAGHYESNFLFKNHAYNWHRKDTTCIDNTMRKKYKYNEQDGFKTSNGCSIPRKERSLTCRLYQCFRQKEKNNKKQELVLASAYMEKTVRDIFGTLEHIEIKYISDTSIKLKVDSAAILLAFTCSVLQENTRETQDNHIKKVIAKIEKSTNHKEDG